MSQANDKLTYLLMFVLYVFSTHSEESKGRMARELPSLSADPENLMTKLPDAWL